MIGMHLHYYVESYRISHVLYISALFHEYLELFSKFRYTSAQMKAKLQRWTMQEQSKTAHWNFFVEFVIHSGSRIQDRKNTLTQKIIKLYVKKTTKTERWKLVTKQCQGVFAGSGGICPFLNSLRTACMSYKHDIYKDIHTFSRVHC